MVLRAWLILAVLLSGTGLCSTRASAETPVPPPPAPAAAPGSVTPVTSTPRGWSQVDVAPTWTSIYIGTVSLTMPTFVRSGATYHAPYAAKVFPYFFSNEKGVLTVNVTDEQLAALGQGKVIEFTGKAVRTDGAERTVTARATPKDAASGKLDVHVFVSKRIQLIFHTTYRFSK